MCKKDRIIINLLAFASILFCILQFIVIPANQKKQIAYTQDQKDALTHDITSIKNYQSAYVGDASNIGNLFGTLPLHDLAMQFEIDSNNCALIVYYLDSAANIGKEKLQRDLLYNTIAAMASIQNLVKISYHFSNEQYTFYRNKIEEVFKSPLSDLLDQEKWKHDVQNKLYATEFLNQFY